MAKKTEEDQGDPRSSVSQLAEAPRPGEPAPDGKERKTGIPSQAEMWWKEGRGGMFPAVELIKFPNDVGEWATRTNLTEEEVQAFIGIVAEDSAIDEGATDWGQLTWMYAGLKRSIGGEATKQFAEVLRGAARAVIPGVMDRLGSAFRGEEKGMGTH